MEYVNCGGEELREKPDVISLVRTISRSIKCKIEVEDARRRVLRRNSSYDSSSGESDDGGRGGGKTPNMCRIPGHNHAWKDCPDNRWSKNYKKPAD